MDEGQQWLTRDVNHFCKSRDMCQCIKWLATQTLAKLITILPKEPFMKQGIYFCGTNKTSKKVYKEQIHIPMTINYATKQVEAKVLRTNIIVMTVKFLYECIITKFGCPLTIDLDQGVHFINDVIKHLTYQFLLT